MAFPKFDPNKTYCNDGTSGKANKCCYYHDKAYKEGKMTRAQADEEFLACCLSSGMFVKAYLMYAALRVGGWYRWNQLRAKDKK